MSIKTPLSLRLAVAQRADFRCKYCGIHESNSIISFQVDHIVSRKHGGPTVLENLAYTCAICNRSKGSDVATQNWPDTRPIRLFNPRVDLWTDCFWIENGLFLAKNELAEATIKVLELNAVERIMERQLLIENGIY